MSIHITRYTRTSSPLYPMLLTDEERRRKFDLLAVPQAMASVSTYPFYDPGPITKVLIPGVYHAAMAEGLHKGRPALVNQGLTPLRAWVYENGVYKGIDENRDFRSGFNIHSDEGVSEGCVTLGHQGAMTAVLGALRTVKGAAVHSDGRQLYTLVIEERVPWRH